MFTKLLKRFNQEPQTNAQLIKERRINSSLQDNLAVIEKLYSIPVNSDVKIRKITLQNGQHGFLLFISTISDVQFIETSIIKPLLKEKTAESITEQLTNQSISTSTKFSDLVSDVNQGKTALFLEGEKKAYLLDTTKFESRGIEKAENEVTLKGPKEAFNERASTNISLIRKRIKNESLVVEMITVSKRSKNTAALLYIKDLANEELVKNIKNRLDSINVDAVPNLALLEQLIEERRVSLFPTILYTERPDRAASFLEDGYVILLMDNSPSSLVLPATFWSFFHNPDEHYLRFLYGNFTRSLRAIAFFITLFTSAIYVSVTNYHTEMIPPDLLLAISATRERVPFPAIIEILFMEIAFELIREAGLRVPNPIGPTIGIVGALILGQAAVEANIISPIVIIVVALGGLSSFAINDVNLNYTIRLARFMFILAGGWFGFYGMTALFTIGMFYMVSIKSFGVPYLAPMAPHYRSSKDTLFRKLIKNEHLRPGYLKPKDLIKKRG